MNEPVDSLRPPRAGASYRFAAGVAFTIIRLQRWRFDVVGADHLPDSGGAVIAANHIGFWDYFTVGYEPYVRRGRPLRILAKDSLFRVPLFGALMRRARHIPVRRGSGRAAYGAAIEALRSGELVLVLPEQTISTTFELLDFKQGAVRMARAAGVPLIPAVSWGSHRFHTVGRRPWPRWRLPVTVVYGEPIHLGPQQDPKDATLDLRSRMLTLLETAQRRYADGAPAGAWWVPARLAGGAPSPDDEAPRLRRLFDGWRES